MFEKCKTYRLLVLLLVASAQGSGRQLIENTQNINHASLCFGE